MGYIIEGIRVMLMSIWLNAMVRALPLLYLGLMLLPAFRSDDYSISVQFFIAFLGHAVARFFFFAVSFFLWYKIAQNKGVNVSLPAERLVRKKE